MLATISTDIYGGRYAFEQARRRADLGQFFGMLTRSSRLLQPLANRRHGGRYAGREMVPVKFIRGTESRSADFDVDFNPLRSVSRDRWTKIFVAWVSGAILPPVELIKSGDIYYVRDGHHRISVAKALDIDYIDAQVMELEPQPCLESA